MLQQWLQTAGGNGVARELTEKFGLNIEENFVRRRVKTWVFLLFH